MTNKPQLGRTKHKWLLGDLDASLMTGQAAINRLIAEIRTQQERPRPAFQDIAMLTAELAQTLSQARTLAKELIDLVEQAPAAELDTAELLAQQIGDLQRQIDDINRRIEP